jgi:hypothetical protein
MDWRKDYKMAPEYTRNYQGLFDGIKLIDADIRYYFLPSLDNVKMQANLLVINTITNETIKSQWAIFISSNDIVQILIHENIFDLRAIEFQSNSSKINLRVFNHSKGETLLQGV